MAWQFCNSAVDGRDRRRLERLCKYLLRPPFSGDAIHRLPDGRVRLELPRKGRCIEMTAEQFLAKLVALVPPASSTTDIACGRCSCRGRRVQTHHRIRLPVLVTSVDDNVHFYQHTAGCTPG